MTTDPHALDAAPTDDVDTPVPGPIPQAQNLRLHDIDSPPGAPPEADQPLLGPDHTLLHQLIAQVRVRVTATLGHTTLSVAELAALADGSVLSLDRGVDEPLDLLLDGQVIARGTLVAVDDQFGLRITHIAQPTPTRPDTAA